MTTVGVAEALLVPRTRGGFHTRVFERYQHRQAKLDTALSEMVVFGTSTAQVGRMVETLTDTHPSPSTVSRVFHTLDAEFETWKIRPLARHYVYHLANGTYFTVIDDGEGQKMPILAVIGINTASEREVLAFTIRERENQGAWEDLLEQLKARGVQQCDYRLERYTPYVDTLLKETTMSISSLRVLSTICFVAGFVSVAASIAIWFLFKEPDSAYGERLGIFIGLWAPTFFALSSRLYQYGAAKVTGS